ncbi:MAG: paraquat-inducible protein A [Bacteroidia bacterium]|nr:paraquat-inducible protein A [Bacteroidia bacterium]
MSIRNVIAFVLILVSLVCLYPGLFEPILTLVVGAEIPILGRINLQESTNSIISTIQTLRNEENYLVAFLILFFSIVVPIIKAVLLLIVLFIKTVPRRLQIFKVVHQIGKWSMADVFVVGVLIAYLGTSSNDNIDAYLHDGFYYFLAYCIISLMAIQFMEVKAPILQGELSSPE